MDAGVKFAFHPHNWTLVDANKDEVKRIMDLTDPKYVFLVADTAHLSLGGVIRSGSSTIGFRASRTFISRMYRQIQSREVRLERPRAKQGRASHGTICISRSARAASTSGFPRRHCGNGYEGWVSLDFDAPKPGEALEVEMGARRKYLVETLHASLRPAALKS